MTDLHSMKCPVCNVDLTMADRQGVEIDYCPQCRGVWLDRGELDKIIERSSGTFGRLGDEEYRGDYEHKRRRSWTDMFDFG